LEGRLSRWSRLHLQSASTNPHWADIVGYAPFSLEGQHTLAFLPRMRSMNVCVCESRRLRPLIIKHGLKLALVYNWSASSSAHYSPLLGIGISNFSPSRSIFGYSHSAPASLHYVYLDAVSTLELVYPSGYRMLSLSLLANKGDSISFKPRLTLDHVL
jgi:hypothetical protein